MKAIHGVSFHLYFFFLIITIALSCDSEQANLSNSAIFELEKLTIELDSIASNYNQLYDHFKSKDTNNLAVMNQINNGVDLYDLDSKKLIKRIDFPINGPFSVSKIDGVKFISLDSFFVFPERKLDGHIISNDTTIEIKKYFNLNNPIFNHHVSSMTPVITYGQKLFLYGLPIGGSPRDTTNNLMLDLILDFEAKSIKRLINNEKKAVDKTWGALGAQTRTLDNLGRIVYSFPFEENLLVYEIEKDSFYTKEISTNLFSKKTRKMTPQENRTKYRLENNYFDGILFDPYKRVYYRFVKLSTNPLHPSGKLKTAFHQKTALQIIDINFKVISEVNLEPTPNFLTKDSFVSERGLCISTANVLNENTLEDFLEFTVIDFKIENQ